ncbi:MAG: phage/plasmid primase, P4 family [Candidatus Jettenia sp.]|nr:MAG: phage/plasmid primase, P4 family [Candidatus Jettenia sp.]
MTIDERPPAFNLADLGNAKRLVAHYGDKIRYCFAWKKWLIWDGKTWSIDDNGQIVRLAKETVKRIYQEASIASDELREKIGKWAIKSEEEKKIKAMISLVQSEDGIPISPGELDGDPFLLNCANGTINLRIGELRSHNPNDFITKMIPVEFNPDAACPTWLEFLETIFNFNYDVIRFLQRAVEYSLTGSTSEQCLFLLHGGGANGKSTFVKTVINLLGDFAQTADFETFLIKNNGDGIRNDLAWMKGDFLNRSSYASDIQSGGFMSASKGRNPCASFRNAVQGFDNIGESVRGFIVENLSYQECIRRFDSESSLFYVDCSYHGSEDYYGKGNFSLQDHYRLLELLHGIRSMAMVSHYECDTYNQLYSNWRRYTFESFKGSSKAGAGQEKPKTTEILYTNFEPKLKTRSLFNGL